MADKIKSFLNFTVKPYCDPALLNLKNDGEFPPLPETAGHTNLGGNGHTLQNNGPAPVTISLFQQIPTQDQHDTPPVRVNFSPGAAADSHAGLSVCTDHVFSVSPVSNKELQLEQNRCLPIQCSISDTIKLNDNNNLHSLHGTSVLEHPVSQSTSEPQDPPNEHLVHPSTVNHNNGMEGGKMMGGGDKFHIETTEPSESDTSIKISTIVEPYEGDPVTNEQVVNQKPLAKKVTVSNVTTPAPSTYHHARRSRDWDIKVSKKILILGGKTKVHKSVQLVIFSLGLQDRKQVSTATSIRQFRALNLEAGDKFPKANVFFSLINYSPALQQEEKHLDAINSHIQNYVFLATASGTSLSDRNIQHPLDWEDSWKHAQLVDQLLRPGLLDVL